MPRKDELRDTPCSPMRMANFPECQVWASRNDCVQFFVFLKLGLGLWLQTILLTKKLSCRTEKADAITQGYKEVKEQRSPSTDVGVSTTEWVRK